MYISGQKGKTQSFLKLRGRPDEQSAITLLNWSIAKCWVISWVDTISCPIYEENFNYILRIRAKADPYTIMSLLRYRENSLVCSFSSMWLKVSGSPNHVPAWLIIWLCLGLGGLPGPFCLTGHHWAESILHFGDVRVACPQVMSMGQHRESEVFGHKSCPHLVQPTVGTRLTRSRK